MTRGEDPAPANGGAVPGFSAALAEELLPDFIAEARERLEHLEELLLRTQTATVAARPALLDEVKRELHTLKGNAGLMGFASLQASAHQMEDIVAGLDPARPAVGPILSGIDHFRSALARLTAEAGHATAPQPAGEVTGTEAAAPGGIEKLGGGVRIPFAALDSLVNLLAEVVVVRNRLGDALARTEPLRSREHDEQGRWREVDDAHERLDATLDQLQQQVLRLRMVPLHSLFRQLSRIVHDTSVQEDKQVRLAVEGADTTLDKALLELASEALGHLVRNAVIHGIEPAEERRRAGKDASGTVRLAARATSREVCIDVEDDGRGVQSSALRAAAQRAGLQPDPGADALELLFLPGLSTRSEADIAAGRGIGLSAVKEAVARQGGVIQVAFAEGRGSLFRLRLPLNASITRALLVSADGEDYALPLRAVLESSRLQPGELHEINGAGALRWRGRVLAALDLGCVFSTAERRRRDGYALILEDGDSTRAVVVDRVLGIREIVVKALDPLVAALPGVAASTLLGDGRAVLILDPASLCRMSPILGARP
ncbi:MAG: chemotaxis protein CheA [Acidobacteriota bacterium]